MTLTGSEKAQIARLGGAGLEMGLPLAAGLAAATTVVNDPAVAIQLALPTHYRTTVLRRLALSVGWTAIVALASASALRITGLWQLGVPESFVVGQLIWLAPLLWMVALGAVLALLLRSRTAASAVLGGLWLAENVFAQIITSVDLTRAFFLFATTYTPGADYWLDNRLFLIGSSLVLAFGMVLALRDGEYLLTGSDE